MTYNAEKCVKPSELVPLDDKPIAIVVGAIATGSVCLYLLPSLSLIRLEPLGLAFYRLLRR